MSGTIQICRKCTGSAFEWLYFAVLDARAGPHELDLPGRITPRRPAVLVLERALENVGQDLHVAVSVRAEALAGLDPVVVQHAQGAEAHVVGIVVVAERKVCRLSSHPHRV